MRLPQLVTSAATTAALVAVPGGAGASATAPSDEMFDVPGNDGDEPDPLFLVVDEAPEANAEMAREPEALEPAPFIADVDAEDEPPAFADRPAPQDPLAWLAYGVAIVGRAGEVVSLA